jgi:hypothetical protein
VEHKASAKAVYHALLVEPAGTVNTGNSGSDKAAPADACN